MLPGKKKKLRSLTSDPFCFSSSWILPGVSGAGEQHHALPRPDGHAALQGDGEPPARHPLAEERRPGGAGAGPHHHPEDRGRVQAADPRPGHHGHRVLPVCGLQLSEGHLCHRGAVRQTG